MLTKQQLSKPGIILPALVVVYFLAFPADLKGLIGLVTDVLILTSVALNEVLALSSAVSPWLYILLSVVILSRTVTRIWGHKT